MIRDCLRDLTVGQQALAEAVMRVRECDGHAGGGGCRDRLAKPPGGVVGPALPAAHIGKYECAVGNALRRGDVGEQYVGIEECMQGLAQLAGLVCSLSEPEECIGLVEQPPVRRGRSCRGREFDGGLVRAPNTDVKIAKRNSCADEAVLIGGVLGEGDGIAEVGNGGIDVFGLPMRVTSADQSLDSCQWILPVGVRVDQLAERHYRVARVVGAKVLVTFGDQGLHQIPRRSLDVELRRGSADGVADSHRLEEASLCEQAGGGECDDRLWRGRPMGRAPQREELLGFGRRHRVMVTVRSRTVLRSVLLEQRPDATPCASASAGLGSGVSADGEGLGVLGVVASIVARRIVGSAAAKCCVATGSEVDGHAPGAEVLCIRAGESRSVLEGGIGRQELIRTRPRDRRCRRGGCALEYDDRIA